jgi:hypothetical protein
MKLALTVAAAIVATSPVPLRVQHAIPKKVPAHLRYVPTEVPIGYRYAKWNGGRHGLNIYFARAGRAPTLGFHALASGAPGTCEQGGTHTYRFASVHVSFESDRYRRAYRAESNHWLNPAMRLRVPARAVRLAWASFPE